MSEKSDSVKPAKRPYHRKVAVDPTAVPEKAVKVKAAKVNPEFKTVAEMRTRIIESLKKNADEISKKNYQQQVIDEAVRISEVEYPVIMEEEEIDSLVRQQMQRWQLDEKGLDEYLSSIKKSAAELREELRPVALQAIKQSLVITEIARSEDIKIEDADLDTEIESLTKNVASDRKKQMVDLLNIPQNQVNLVTSIATRKTVEKLVEIAQSQAVTETKPDDTEAKKPEA